MVVENPLSSDEMESLKEALEEKFSGSIGSIEAETASGSYDYSISFKQTQPKPKMRSVSCKVKWHDDKSDWEIGEVDSGYWRS